MVMMEARVLAGGGETVMFQGEWRREACDC